MSLRPKIVASPNPCAAILADSFVNQGLLNNAPPANLVLSCPCIALPLIIEGNTIEDTRLIP